MRLDINKMNYYGTGSNNVSIGECRFVRLDKVVIGDNEAKDMRESATARSCRNV